MAQRRWASRLAAALLLVSLSSGLGSAATSGAAAAATHHTDRGSSVRTGLDGPQWPAGPASVAATDLTFTVNSTADTNDANPGDGICADSAGQCTLRAATQEADAQPSGSSITINVPAGTYGLTLGTLQLTANSITISGALSSTTIISGNNTGTVMAIASPVHARLRQLTLSGGNGGSGDGGGLVNQGTTALSQSMVLSNTAGNGGGIYSTGMLTMTSTTLSGNTASYAGGGIYKSGRLSVTNSTLSGNTASSNCCSDGGGAIYNRGGPLSVVTSTFSHNIAKLSGGGIFNFDGTLSVTSSTFSRNSASSCCSADGGGGIYDSSFGAMSVMSSTFSHNSGGGIYNRLAPLNVANSTFSRNSGPFGGIYNAAFSPMSVMSSTFSNNNASGIVIGSGAGIYNWGASLSVASSTFTGNTTTGDGGGIFNGGDITVTNSTFSGNFASANGGGIYQLFDGVTGVSTLSVLSSTLSDNSASGGGGIAIVNNGAIATLTNSTISSNHAAYSGGGIYNYGMLTLMNSTLSGNSATDGGGGLVNGCSGGCGSGTSALSYDTIASNSDGIDNIAGTITFTGAIIANSTSGPNCTGAIADHGHNLDSGTSCGFSRATDITNTSPLLGPLANNGGPTQTMALLSGSPAIDHGGTSATGCPATDQRGMPRPDEAADSGACDMGAYESQGVG